MPPNYQNSSTRNSTEADIDINHPITSLAEVANLISAASSIVVLTGAGISVSCGIPDFRSRGGLYDTVRDKYGLPDPEIIFDLTEFHDDPTVFYSFAKHVMPPPSLSPSPTHYFIAQLAARSKLLRVYSQNIDGLESRAGVPDNQLLLCHGSFLSASCTLSTCDASVPGSQIVDHVLTGDVPQCDKCMKRHENKQRKRRKTSRSGKSKSRRSFSAHFDDDDDEPDIGVMKPDIVFFGEKLPSRVSASINRDVRKADLVLVIGTSLTVEPVASIPRHFERSVPRILINQQPVKHSFNVELIGDCDIIIRHIADALNWPDACTSPNEPEGDIRAQVLREGSNSVSKKEGNDIEDELRITYLPPKRFLFKGGDLTEPG